MQDGTIQSLVSEKGFGFIKPVDGGADIFFHCSAVDAPFETLVVGQAIRYELDETSAKPKSRRVATGNDFVTKTKKDGRKDRALASPRSRRSSPRADQQAFEYGFVTKLHRKEFLGYISSVRHGPEYLFLAESVVGEKRFSRLQIGDYVQFLVGERTPDNPKQPIANAIKVVKREIKTPSEKQLSRHPKARHKKPTWRR